MKRLTFLLFLPIIIIVLCSTAVKADAMKTGFSTEELTQEDKNTFISNIDISLLTSEPVKQGIRCFDVNEEGMIAIAQNGRDGKEICVYSSDGTFLYGYVFDCSQSYGVEWDGANLNIYFVRSDVIISVDADGNILDIKKVRDTIDNNSYSNSLLYSTKRIVGNTTYVIRNDFGVFNWIATSYSELIAIDATGEEHVIYDVSSTQFIKTVVIFVAILAAVVIAFVIIFSQQRKKV